MRVLVAPDKWAGSLTAVEAVAAIARGWGRAVPAVDIDAAPLSDGGPGFLQVLATALEGRWESIEVAGPLGPRVSAGYVVHDDAGVRTVYVEAAQACGLALVRPSPRTAEEASTAGVGELLLAALRESPDRVVVGVGGTASTDGGRGCVEVVAPRGWPEGVRLLAATDVLAPLLGPLGAAHLFGPQKGADAATTARLEGRLEAWAADSVKAGVPPDTPGAGAGGGLGFGLLLLGADVVGGADMVLDAIGLAARMASADVVVTGEGRLDASSLLGKAPMRVAGMARDLGRPCILLVGDRVLEARELDGRGVTAVHSLAATYGPAAALDLPSERLADLAEQVAEALADDVPPP